MTPTNRTVAALCALALLSVIPALYPWVWPLWVAISGAFIMWLAIDAWQLSKVSVDVERQNPKIIAHQQTAPITLTLFNRSEQIVNLQVHDGHPAHCVVDQQPVNTLLGPQSQATLHYTLRSGQRGVLDFEVVHCRIQTRVGWLRKPLQLTKPAKIKVYPNFKTNRLYGYLLSSSSLHAVGIKRKTQQGEGSDFRQLREFRDGDALRQVDWKATSRARKLISREFQQERDQQIVFLLDCSQRMRHQGADASHMDNSLNAVMLLAQVALKQGDSTGLMTFGGEERWVPPGKGAAASNQLIDGLFDLQATQAMPDYDAAVENLQRRLTRRALVIIVTQSRNEDGESATNAFRRLSKKHVVLIADLQESDLRQALSAETSKINDAVQWFSAQSYQQERQRRHSLARANGALLLDVAPEQLSAALVTEYLDIKNRAVL